MNSSSTVNKMKISRLPSTKGYVVPYLIWCFILIVIPSIILIFIAFTNYNFENEIDEIRFTLANWEYIFKNETAVKVFWPAIGRSFLISMIVTIACLLLGYPVAYLMKTVKRKTRAIIMALLVLPLWSNQVLKIVSWRTIFELLNMNKVELYALNTVIAMISMYLPFMILPIYTVLEKIDPKVVEASYDLGCNPTLSFIKVIFPLSLGGIVSGIIMTFLPSLTQFEVSDVVSNYNLVLLGNLIYSKFKGVGGFNVGSVYSLFAIVFTLIGFAIVMRVDKEGETLL